MSELRRLARHTALSGIAFASTGLVGLLLIPVIIGRYGVAAFGLIIVARSLLPSYALAVLDFGVSETTTQSVGRARGSGNWTRASEELSWLLAVSCGIGVVLGVTLALAAPTLADVFHADDAHRAKFADVLLATAVALPIAFSALVSEGVARGFERFALLRGLEVASSLSYAAGTLLAVHLGASYEVIAYVFLATLLARQLLLAWWVRREALAAGLRWQRWSAAAAQDVGRRSRLLLASRLTGVLQFQAVPLILGALVGPAAAGLYDVLTRLPRFAKSTLGLLTSAILPLAARLEGSGQADRFRQLGEVGTWLVPFFAFPPLFTLAALSHPVLEAWVGADMAAHWPWFALTMVVPTLQILLSLSQTMLQVRADYIAAMNRIQIAAVLVQYAVALVLIPWFGGLAFVAGVAVAAVAAFVPQARLTSSALGIERAATMLRPLQCAALLAGPAVLLGAAAARWHAASIAVIMCTAGASTLAGWAIAYRLWLDAPRRALLRRLVTGLLPSTRNPR